MRANANGVYSPADGIQCRKQLCMYAIEVGMGHQALTNALLVCDYRYLPASIVERLDGIHNTGEEFEFIWCTNVLTREVLVNHTIPVEERNTPNRFQ
jgi:hypothetical protein